MLIDRDPTFVSTPCGFRIFCHCFRVFDAFSNAWRESIDDCRRENAALETPVPLAMTPEARRTSLQIDYSLLNNRSDHFSGSKWGKCLIYLQSRLLEIYTFASFQKILGACRP